MRHINMCVYIYIHVCVKNMIHFFLYGSILETNIHSHYSSCIPTECDIPGAALWWKVLLKGYYYGWFSHVPWHSQYSRRYDIPIFSRWYYPRVNDIIHEIPIYTPKSSTVIGFSAINQPFYTILWYLMGIPHLSNATFSFAKCHRPAEVSQFALRFQPPGASSIQ